MIYNDEGRPTYARYVFAMIAKQLPPGPKRVLNAGCGNNWLKKYAPKGWTVTGLDINNPSADIHADLESKLPIKSGTYDAVVALHIVEHLRNPVVMLAECERVLVPGGVVYISTPSPWSANAWEDPYHIRPYTVGALRSLGGDAKLVMQSGFYTLSTPGFGLLRIDRLERFYLWFTTKLRWFTLIPSLRENVEAVLVKPRSRSRQAK